MWCGVALVALGGVLFAHMTFLPLHRGRAVVWHGREAMVATLALLAGLVLVAVHPWGWALAGAGLAAVATVSVALVWGPAWVWGASADAVWAGAARAASMVRARWEEDSPSTATRRRARVAGALTVTVRAVGGSACVVVMRGRRSPKVRLWRQVFRKQARNHVWRVR